ncbi:hypothetical protein OQH61_05420 [Helicobacter sp. MIT 21-1697]|uniref:hypothetical protein n=1 Tax=Helicobacter sp. MIT 21-1697 TaxID=2993733 RepID=UPI00224AD280|nr:hypothetical protein [Helicobacter sp. MIT 21-1697]MCX2717173.1 hypothetical protein [Helicobacter sp. MIT 21-1697]
MCELLKFLLRPFFSTVLIGVNLDAKVCSLKIVVLKNGHVKNSVSKEFKIVNKELPMEAAKLIADYKRKYPFTYLSAMSKTYNQGLANCSKKGELIKFGVNAKTSHIVEMPNHWLFYIQQLAVDENRVKFIRALGLDYLFSPFVLVYENIKGRLTDKVRLYVLQERASITLFVADKKGVYFGGFFMVGGELENAEDKGASVLEIHSAKEMSDLDSILGSIDELKEIGELEDLDEELIRKEFTPQEIDSQKQQEAEMSRLEGLRDLARASNATEILKNSINEFYSNPIYNSTQFIETIVLLDTYGMTEQAVAHIRNTLMIEVEVRSIHIPDALIDLSKAELKDNRG